MKKNHLTPPLISLFFVSAGDERGNFRQKQKEGDHLKHCWSQVQAGRNGHLAPQHVFSCPKRVPLIKAYTPGCAVQSPSGAPLQGGHRHVPAAFPPFGVHLGAKNTLVKVRDRFHWPGMVAEVKNFVKIYEQCQRTLLWKAALPPPLPIPLPIIEVLFKQVGIDSPRLTLPQSTQGHEYILVVSDFTTRYPEVLPLQKVTSKAIIRELVLLFSRVGIPKEILSFQRTPPESYMSWSSPIAMVPKLDEHLRLCNDFHTLNAV